MFKVDAKRIITGVMNLAFLIDRSVRQLKDCFMSSGSAPIAHSYSSISIRPWARPEYASVRHQLRIKSESCLRPISEYRANLYGVISLGSFFIMSGAESALNRFSIALFDNAYHAEAPLCRG